MTQEKEYSQVTIEKQVLGYLLNHEFYQKVKNIVTKDMFTGRDITIFDAITYAHKKYGQDMHPRQISAVIYDRNPAMPTSAITEIYEVIDSLPIGMSNDMQLEMDVVKNFWVRDKARQIGEKAIAIFTGESEHFGELKTLIDMVEDGRMSDKTTYTEVTTDFADLIKESVSDPDFPFEWDLMNDKLAGMDRGNLGIIFARPEVGKTTFCAFLASSYIRQRKRVVYWANEEPAHKIKLRIIQSFFAKTNQQMSEEMYTLHPVYKEQIEPFLVIMDSVGTSMEELDNYAQLNEPDVMFCDQLDKFRIGGEFNRGDERLKETYVTAREIAKRNKLLLWSVSQASYDAHDRQFVDYAMLDGSRTGKAGEADVIIGIGKTGGSDEENTARHICISKNKINGWHGMFTSHIDINAGVYY